MTPCIQIEVVMAGNLVDLTRHELAEVGDYGVLIRAKDVESLRALGALLYQHVTIQVVETP